MGIANPNTKYVFRRPSLSETTAHPNLPEEFARDSAATYEDANAPVKKKKKLINKLTIIKNKGANNRKMLFFFSKKEKKNRT